MLTWPSSSTIIPAKAADSSVNDIGVPLDTVSCFVIPTDYSSEDPSSFRLLEAGDVGELAVGGHQNAIGYLNRPDQTAGAFINTPFGPMYRTGDLARLRENGSLECLGRMSEGQVKLRGQRIELGEVEHAVLRTPGCHSAVAAVINRILVVFCAVDSIRDEKVLAESIAQKCSEWLPAFMVPGDIVVMDRFPRLPSGKVDRNLMKANYERPALVNGDPRPAEGSHGLPGLVGRCISETLGMEVGERTVLASAGLDSLGAIRLASRLRKEGIQVSALQVLKAKTIHDLCQGISEVRPCDFGLDGQSELAPEYVETVLDSFPLLRELHKDVVSVLPCTP
ncbi:non-ribosomal peptide synthetase, partial [Candidatus Bathyarchaeota archaeon]|nr:non-ribosomal peptide synthetase [Candidatus Bathyarchaeota archaeon]